MTAGVTPISAQVDEANDPRRRELPPNTAYHPVARKFADEEWTMPGMGEPVPRLRHWRGNFMEWTGPRYEALGADTIPDAIRSYTEFAYFKVMVRKELKERNWEPNRSRVAEVEAALAQLLRLPEAVEQPCWLDDDEHPPAKEFVSCANGLLHLGDRTLLEPTPMFFNTASVAVAYDPDAPVPTRWLSFLAELWLGDEQAHHMLQEWFGYIVSGRYDLQKMLLLIGPRRAGKGTIARLLEALVGDGNHSGISLSTLGETFGLEGLVGKSLSVVGDARLGRDSARTMERLLTITGADEITVNRKYRPAWVGRLPVRIIINTNDVPHFVDPSGALAGRCSVLHFKESFFGREDPQLGEALLEELPGILNWALEGLDRLNKNGGHFTEVDSSADTRDALEASSPTQGWVEERCNVGPEYSVWSTAAYDDFVLWAKRRGYEHPPDISQWGKQLRAVLPKLTRSRPRVSGDRTPTLIGIRIDPTAPDLRPVDQWERDI